MYGYGGYTGGYPTGVGQQQQMQMYQNRLNQMEQQYGAGYQQAYQQQMQQPRSQMLKGRPVSSYDEAKASMIDLDGSMYVFTDIANKKIYTKQIMLDGTAELKTYVLSPQQVLTDFSEQNVANEGYVLRSDFDKIVKELNDKIVELKGGYIDVTTDDVTNV